jgi:hypothetical protein
MTSKMSDLYNQYINHPRIAECLNRYRYAKKQSNDLCFGKTMIVFIPRHGDLNLNEMNLPSSIELTPEMRTELNQIAMKIKEEEENEA